MVESKPGKTRRKEFTIPVFPHVKKFVFKKYRAFRVRSKIRTEEHTLLGKVVTLALKDNRLRQKYQDSQYRDRLTDTLTLELTKEQSEFSPRPYKLIRINQALDDAFKEHLLTWVGAQQEAGVPAYAACKMFLQFYDIDEQEYTLDAAYRLWQRSKGED